MNKITGLMCAWACEKWIEPAIQQALTMCDEVIVAIGWHSKAMEKFKDNTMQLALKHPVKFIVPAFCGNHAQTKAATMNKMLMNSSNFKVNNWIWLLDVDEFYLSKEVDQIKSVIFNSDYNSVKMNEKFFFINMQNYIKNTRMRLWKITNINDKFYPTNKWTGDRSKSYDFKGEGLFHYSMLLNPHAKRAFWASEYNHSQNNKIEWLDSYLNDDFDFSMFSGFKDNNGSFFKHNEKHPDFIEKTNLTKIPDFRKVY